MFEECFAMIELAALSEAADLASIHGPIDFDEMSRKLVAALELALFGADDAAPAASVH